MPRLVQEPQRTLLVLAQRTLLVLAQGLVLAPEPEQAEPIQVPAQQRFCDWQSELQFLDAHQEWSSQLAPATRPVLSHQACPLTPR